MDKVRGFDIPVEDMRRAKKFYHEIFDWQIRPVSGSGGDFHSVQTVPEDENGNPLGYGINGGLYKKGTRGLETVFLEVQVDSIDATIQKVVHAGGALVRPKSPILDFAYFAVVKDTEGNYIGLWEEIGRK